MDTLADRQVIEQWLNQPMRISLSDGRVVVGTFLCTDRDCNIILGQTKEYWPVSNDEEDKRQKPNGDEPRLLGLAMVPGRHLVSVSVLHKRS